MENTMPVITTFINQEFGKVRSLLINNEPYFVGKDVAEILGYAKPENAIGSHVDEEDKTSTLIQGSGSNYKSKAIIINESGLYSLILSSKLPGAKKFKHWVTSEVLPSIRKNGGYYIPKTYSEALQLCANQTKKIEEMQPKADVYDKICNSETLKSVDTVASNLGFGKNNFFALMRGMGIFYYSTQADGKKINLPKQEYKDRGYFVTKEEPYNRGDKDCLYTKIYVTGKGETWLAKTVYEETADAFMKKGEAEYQKIMDKTAVNYLEKAMKNCPPTYHTILDVRTYTISEVAKLSNESEETVENYCLMQKWFDENGNPTLYGVDIIQAVTWSGDFTEKGKDAIVSVYAQISYGEKGMKKTSLGKAE